MIDRFGRPLALAWCQIEIMWVEAALTLKGKDRYDAFKDIAEMAGRTYAAVITKASDIRLKREADYIEKCVKIKRAAAARATPWVPNVPPRISLRVSTFIRPLSKAELMQGRAA